MKKIILLSLFVGLFQFSNAQDLYQIVDGEVSFFSTTPVEDIDAVNKTVKGLINTKNNDVAFIVTIVGFHFKKPLMEEHFNENYMESDKKGNETAMFKGVIIEKIDYTKDGEYDVSAKGTLTVHGVAKDRIIKGKLIIKAGKIQLITDFDIQLADHDVKIPKVVTKKIAETVAVKVNANFEKK
jgi:hypothetical protein